MDDWDLLRSYANEGSESAFSELVRRHLDLVYSVAFRKLGDVHAVGDVAQAVFCLLARKAPRLKPGGSLAGWLYRTACYQASEHWRRERQRLERENQAVMEIQNSPPETDAAWEELAPLLDEAMQQLNDADRTSILLRFFENRPLREVGLALDVDEDAARKRVSRAVERLRTWFAHRGVTCSATALVGAVSANAVQAAPAGLGLTISQAVFATGGTAVGATCLTQTVPLLSALTSAKVITLVAIALGILLSIPVALRLTRVTGTLPDGSDPPAAIQTHTIGPFTAALTNRVGAGQTLVVGGFSRSGMRAFVFLTPVVEAPGQNAGPPKVTVNTQGILAPDGAWEQLGWGRFRVEGRIAATAQVLMADDVNAVFTALTGVKSVDITNRSSSTVEDGERINFGWGVSGGNGQIVDVFGAFVYPRITPDGRSVDLGFRPYPPSRQTANSGG